MSSFESAINDLSEQFRALTQRTDEVLKAASGRQASVADKAADHQPSEDDQLTQIIGDLDEAINTSVARFAAVVSVQEAHEPAEDVRSTDVYQNAYEALRELAKQFSLLLAAVQSRQQQAAKSADTARRRHNAAQRYLDSSGYH